MDVLYQRCCGLDVHKKVVLACVIISQPDGQVTRQVRRFGAMTDDLLALGDWLGSHAVTHVAMESTSVYWKPIYNLLEANFSLLLVNPTHIKAVPGRKTDVKDCEWIADLLRHGLLRASFVPDRPQRELRELTRYRTSIIQQRAAEVNRVQKTLEGGNIKLAGVASNVLGVSGRDMLEQLIEGSAQAASMAQLARGKLRQKLPELEKALRGRFADHQRFLLAEQLGQIDCLDELIARLDAEVAKRMAACEAEINRLDGIPGIARRAAEVILAEIGVDLTRFPSAAHLAKWAGVCPGNRESAGKRLSGKVAKGNKWLSAILIETAHACGRTATFLGAQFRRLTRRRGMKRGALAVAHSQLVIVYHLLTGDQAYRELGANYHLERDREHQQRQALGKLRKLGYEVTLKPIAA